MTKNFLFFGHSSILFKSFFIQNEQLFSNNNSHISFGNNQNWRNKKLKYIKWNLKDNNFDISLYLKKNIENIIVIYIHDWNQKNIEIHISEHKNFLKSFKNIEYDYTIFYISSLSAFKTAKNSYGKLKYNLEKIYLKNSANIIKIGLIEDLKDLPLNKTLSLMKKLPILFITGGKEIIQTINITNLNKKIFKIINKTGLKNQQFNLFEESISFEDYLKKNRNILVINIPFFIFFTFISTVYFLKLIDFRTLDSIKGLGKRKIFKNYYDE